MSLNAPFKKGAADGFPLNRFTRREARETARLFPSGEGARSVPSRAARPRTAYCPLTTLSLLTKGEMAAL